MNKYIISTALTLTAVSLVSAQTASIKATERTGGVQAVTTTSARVQGMPTGTQGSMPAIQMVQPTITTGDATIDAKIKVLQAEMEAKLKAIREEYQAKIKTVIGDKKVTMTTAGGTTMERGSTTRMEGRMDMKGSSTMMMHREGEMMNGSGTPEGRPATNAGTRIPSDKQVRGESTSSTSETSAEASTGIRGFFGRLFGR